ncbi:MAG: hypothetical protein HOO92_07515, partial [Methylococcaceae bacterium]|nr:hypothetical protein [Methylococcaceae bacterium]
MNLDNPGSTTQALDLSFWVVESMQYRLPIIRRELWLSFCLIIPYGFRPVSRNFGIGSRDMADAGRTVVNRLFHGGYQSRYDIGQRWGFFSKWAAERGIRKMENITRELVAEYGRQLQAELDAGDRRSSSAPKNYVSAVNTVLRLATNGTWQPVRPGRDCGIQPRRYIPTE